MIRKILCKHCGQIGSDGHPEGWHRRLVTLRLSSIQLCDTCGILLNAGEVATAETFWREQEPPNPEPPDWESEYGEKISHYYYGRI